MMRIAAPSPTRNQLVPSYSAATPVVAAECDGTNWCLGADAAAAVPVGGDLKFLGTVSGLTGGGSTKLDGQTTAGGRIVTGSVRSVVVASRLSHYQLQVGTTAEASPIFIVGP